jgi:hypothetical protein
MLAVQGSSSSTLLLPTTQRPNFRLLLCSPRYTKVHIVACLHDVKSSRLPRSPHELYHSSFYSSTTTYVSPSSICATYFIY